MRLHNILSDKKMGLSLINMLGLTSSVETVNFLILPRYITSARTAWKRPFPAMTLIVACVSFVAETCLSSRCLAMNRVIMSQYSFLFCIVLQIMLLVKCVNISQFPRFFYCPKWSISHSTLWNALRLTATLPHERIKTNPFWCNDTVTCISDISCMDQIYHNTDKLTSRASAVYTFITHTHTHISSFLKLSHKLSNMNRKILCTARKKKR